MHPPAAPATAPPLPLRSTPRQGQPLPLARLQLQLQATFDGVWAMLHVCAQPALDSVCGLGMVWRSTQTELSCRSFRGHSRSAIGMALLVIADFALVLSRKDPSQFMGTGCCVHVIKMAPDSH